MAARTKKIRHDAETRNKIQAAQLINRLTKGFNGEVELSATQVSIGLGLLRKVLPDLSQAELDVETTERRVVSGKPLTDDEWAERYASDLGATARTTESLN